MIYLHSILFYIVYNFYPLSFKTISMDNYCNYFLLYFFSLDRIEICTSEDKRCLILHSTKTFY